MLGLLSFFSTKKKVCFSTEVDTGQSVVVDVDRYETQRVGNKQCMQSKAKSRREERNKGK